MGDLLFVQVTLFAFSDIMTQKIPLQVLSTDIACYNEGNIR